MKFEEILLSIIGIIFIICLISAIVFIGFAINSIISEKVMREKTWNNGICPDCNIRYEFFQAVGHRSSTTYIYRCNNCGTVIEQED